MVRLGNKACDEDVSLELVYITALHVYLARERTLQEKLKEKFKDIPEIVVWTFSMLGFQGLILYRAEVQNVLSKTTAPQEGLALSCFKDIPYKD